MTSADAAVGREADGVEESLPATSTVCSSCASASRQSRAAPSSQVVSASVPSGERSSDGT